MFQLGPNYSYCMCLKAVVESDLILHVWYIWTVCCLTVLVHECNLCIKDLSVCDWTFFLHAYFLCHSHEGLILHHPCAQTTLDKQNCFNIYFYLFEELAKLNLFQWIILINPRQQWHLDSLSIIYLLWFYTACHCPPKVYCCENIWRNNDPFGKPKYRSWRLSTTWNTGANFSQFHPETTGGSHKSLSSDSCFRRVIQDGGPHM